jgi:hypothetical protein
MRRAALALLLASLTDSAAAAVGAPTLRRPLSPRATAMAEAYAAVPGGLSSLGINPAGLAAAARPELAATYNSGIMNDTFGFFAWAQPLPLGTAAAGLSYYDAGNIELRFANGQTETRNAGRDLVGHLAWALPLPAGLSAGATLKYYQFELAQEARASGPAADLGAQWATPIKGLSLGGSTQNMGPGVKFEEESDPLPLTVRGGASWSWKSASVAADSPDTYVLGTHFLASAEAIKTRDESVVAAFGSELAMDFATSTLIALRFGWRFNTDADRMTLGLGVREGRYTLDYAFGDKRSLGQVHHAGLGVRF